MLSIFAQTLLDKWRKRNTTSFKNQLHPSQRNYIYCAAIYKNFSFNTWLSMYIHIKQMLGQNMFPQKVLGE